MPVDRESAAQSIDAFLRSIGRDVRREPELEGTGARVAEAFAEHLCAGYAIDTRALLLGAMLRVETTHGAGLVVVRDAPIVTTCPHHLMPASGTVTLAFQARERLVGLGALTELIWAHARRLTLQESLGDAIVSDMFAVLEPVWAGCRIGLVHGCMIARGERATGARVETVALRGAETPDVVGHAHAILGVGRA